MTSLESTSAALSSVDAKKDNVQQVFEDLQSQSSLFSSFTQQWKEFEEHLNSIQKMIDHRLTVLESKGKQGISLPKTVKAPAEVPMKKSEKVQVTPTPELKSLCVNMDGKGLCLYVIDNRDDLPTVRAEVSVALQSAPDSAMLVLEAMQGFYPSYSKSGKDDDLFSLRRTCILLLEQLASISPQIKPEVKDKAKKLAVEWKGRLRPDRDPLEVVSFLQLIGTYDLVSSFGADKILDLVVTIAGRKQAVDLFRFLNMPDKASDLIQKLADKGKQLDAVKFVYGFDLVDKFPPVPLLKAYVRECRKAALNTRQKEAPDKEIAGLRKILKCIEEHDLESEYPCETLYNRIEQLETQRSKKKRLAAARTPEPQQQTGNKRARPNEPAPPVTVIPATSVPPLAPLPPLLPNPVLPIPDRVNPYLMPSAGLYGLGGPTSNMSYSLSGSPMGYGGSLSSTRSHLYSSESLSSDLYGTSSSHVDHDLLARYRPSYYP